MSRVLEFSDGAERGDTSWWTVITNNNTSVTIDTTKVIHGTYCYKMTGPNGNHFTHKIIPAQSDFYFRCYVNVANDANVIRFRAGTAVLVSLAYSLLFNRWDITGATTGNTGNNSTPINTWQCLEVHYKISDTVGVLTVRIDGVEVFTFSGDTKPGADSTVDNIQFVLGLMYVDDFALDTSDWCGLGYYIGLTANGAGDVTQWTPTGGANYANVSIPANDATYNTGTTGQTDNYAMTTTTLGAADVLRVIPFVRASNPAAGTLNVGVKTEGTNYTSAVTTPTALTWLTGAEYINNPNTGNTWQQAEFDALQFVVDVP